MITRLKTYKRAKVIRQKITLLETQLHSLSMVTGIQLIKDNREVLAVEDLKKITDIPSCEDAIVDCGNEFLLGIKQAIERSMDDLESEFNEL